MNKEIDPAIIDIAIERLTMLVNTEMEHLRKLTESKNKILRRKLSWPQWFYSIMYPADILSVYDEFIGSSDSYLSHYEMRLKEYKKYKEKHKNITDDNT